MSKALVLSGGGAKGAWQAGVLLGLCQSGFIQDGFDIISGVSVGAINGAFLAQYRPRRFSDGAHDLCDMWMSIKGNKDIFRWRFPKYIAGMWNSSLATTEPLRALLTKNICPNKLCSSGVSLRIGAYNLQEETLSTFTERTKDIVSAVMASSSYPLMFPPEVINGQQYVDGGLKDIAPVSAVRDYGANSILVVSCTNPNIPHRTFGFVKNIIQMIPKVIGAPLTEVLYNDLYNNRQFDGAIHIVMPEQALGGSMSFNQKEMEQQLYTGIQDGHRYAAQNM